MQHDDRKALLVPGLIFAIAAVVVAMLFAWEGNKGLNLWDEGYLWYGAQRVLQGEVPIRDFMSYDPGRYYWSAAVMWLLGDDGIMNLRVAGAIFQMAGLFVGLLLIAREHRNNTLFLLLSAGTLALWMMPLHKEFDITASIFLVGMLSYLLQNPVRSRYFLTGVVVGLVAVFGRNHGVYGVAGSLAAFAWLGVSRSDNTGLRQGMLAWAAGVAAGYLPVLLMIALVPGFGSAFWNFLFERGISNIALPFPWPWRENSASLPTVQVIHNWLVALYFILLPAFGVLAIAWAARRRMQSLTVSPTLLAAAFMALPYAHRAFSRTDIFHLSQSIYPLLLGCLALLAVCRPRIKWTAGLALAVSSVLVMLFMHPGWKCYMGKQCVEEDIAGDRLEVHWSVARDIRLLRELAREYAPNDGQSFIATPYWPGAYAVLKRKSPMWTIYAPLPHGEDFQQLEINRIKASNPRFAIVLDMPLDGHDELRFSRTNPLIYRYITNNFELLPQASGPVLKVYTARTPAP